MQITLRDVDNNIIAVYKSTLIPRVGEKIKLFNRGEYRVLDVAYTIVNNPGEPDPQTWVDINVDYLEVSDES